MNNIKNDVKRQDRYSDTLTKLVVNAKTNEYANDTAGHIEQLKKEYVRVCDYKTIADYIKRLKNNGYTVSPILSIGLSEVIELLTTRKETISNFEMYIDYSDAEKNRSACEPFNREIKLNPGVSAFTRDSEYMFLLNSIGVKQTTYLVAMLNLVLYSRC